MALSRYAALLGSASALALVTGGVAHAQAPAAAETELEAVVVTGTRLQTAGFNAPTPVTVVGAAQLEQRAPTSVAQALYDLPVFQNGGPTRNTFGSTTIGMNQLNLRGLGAERTLVLVDGRRYVPSSTTTAFDTNLIPNGLVERTEVVTGGASAAYGSDAIAGVVNIILKDRLEGVHGNIQYGQSEYNDDISWTASLYGGAKFGKAHLILGTEWARNGGVGGYSNGPYVRPWGRNEFGQVSLTTRPAGVPANVIASNAEFSNMTPGGVIISGPLRGTAFSGGQGTYQLVYPTLTGNALMTPSTQNFGYFTQARQPLAARFERIVSYARLTVDLNDTTTFFIDGNYGDVEGHNNTADPQFGPGGQVATGGLMIATGAFTAAGFAPGSLAYPFLPTSVQNASTAAGLRTVAVGRVYPENGGFSTNNTSLTKQVATGFRGDIFDNWRWDAYVSYGKNRYTLDVPNVINMPNLFASIFPATVNGQLVCGTAALNAINPNLNAITRNQVQPNCVPLNIVGPGSINGPAMQYIRNHMFYHIQSRQTAAAANIAGSPFSTWAGEVSTAVGLEWRKQSADATADAVGVYGGNLYGNYQAFQDKSITVKEAYGEIGVPLARDLPFAQALDVNGAVRRTDYSTSGAVTTWKVGATWEPTNFLRLRTTRSRDIRAANLGELYASTGGVTQATNQFTGQQATVPSQAVGNPNLTPEIADTFTVGVILQPLGDQFWGFRTSVDYYRIEIGDVIGNLPTTLLDAQCFGPAASRQTADYCNQYFVGYDPSVVDPASPNFRTGVGYSGRRNSGLNLNALNVAGMDFEVALRPPVQQLGVPGAFDVRFLASYLEDRQTVAPTFNAQGQRTGTAPQPDAAGSMGTPKWRYFLGFNYRLNNFSANFQARAFTHMKFNTNLVGPDDAAYNPAANNSINKNIFPGLVYFDMGASYALINRDGRRVQVYGAIDNLLDKDPPFGWIQNMSSYETIGRSYRVGVRFSY